MGGDQLVGHRRRPGIGYDEAALEVFDPDLALEAAADRQLFDPAGGRVTRLTRVVVVHDENGH